MSRYDPLSELNAIGYLKDAENDTAELRRRSFGVYSQLLSIMALLFIFLYNSYRSIKMVCKRSYRASPWCCLVSSLAGVSYVGGIAMVHHLPFGPSCHIVIWAAIIGMTISTMAINTLLLERAYLAHQRNRYLLIFGILLVVPAPVLIYRAWYDVLATFSPGTGCHGTYPPSFPAFRLLIDLPPNAVFSVAFLAVIYQQYRRFGDRCWKRLTHDGITTMLLVILSNLTCVIFNLSDILGDTKDVLFIVDWAITSSLVVENTYRMSTSLTDTEPTVCQQPIPRRQHRKLPSRDFQTQAIADSQYTLKY
ncbi:hypothetical protein BDF19DRAFT_465784 [Syncephalis fuscata]|nr:hypothetical protein BDF19DRAFT_465784 [Syncephalis fuscata]